MSSLQSTSLHEIPTRTRFPDSLRLFRMRPVVTAVKKIFHKIKDIPLFRRRRSEYIPFEQWQALYMVDQLEEEFSSTTAENTPSTTIYDYEFASVEKKRFARDFLREEALVPKDSIQNISSSQDTGNVDVLVTVVDARFSAVKDIKTENNAVTSSETGVSHTNPPSDLTIVKGVSMSLNQESQTQVGPDLFYPKRAASVNTEETAEETNSTLSLDEHAFGRDFDISYDSNTSPKTSQSETHLRNDGQSTSTFEEIYSPGSTIDSNGNGVAVEKNVLQVENKLNHEPQSESRIHGMSEEFEKVSSGSPHFSRNKSTALGSSMHPKLRNGTPAVFEDMRLENSVESTREPDNGIRAQGVDLQSNGGSMTGTSGRSCEKNAEPVVEEKAKRIEHLRKRVAAKKEARLRRALRYASRETAVLGNVDAERTATQPVKAVRSDCSRNAPSKMSGDGSGDGKVCGTETSEKYDRLVWSKEQARQAYDRRKRNQRQRILKLLSMALDTQ